MIHIMNEKKTYQSPLRQEQMQRTREQILEGLIRVMARGMADLSIPEVAREAGVSVPTVYRYFKTKRELIAALGTYTLQKLGAVGRQPPSSVEELIAGMKELSRKYEELDETVRAAAMSEFAYEARRAVLPARLKMIENALAPVTGSLSQEDRIRLRNSVLVLSSTAMIRAFKDYLGLTGEETADTIEWAIRILCEWAAGQKTNAGGTENEKEHGDSMGVSTATRD
jgi:AcrR family transcriptional regulator